MSRIPQPPQSRFGGSTRTPTKSTANSSLSAGNGTATTSSRTGNATATTSSRTGNATASSSTLKPPPSPAPGGRTLRPQPSLKSVKSPPSPSKSTPGGRTLRPQPSLKSVRSPPSPSKSPVRRAPAKTKPINDEPPEVPKVSSMSIREQIALKRAEAQKKAKSSGGSAGLNDLVGLEEALPQIKKSDQDENIDLGRWSVKETIERGRTSGIINLASRALPCLPSALFEIHLGIKPEPLKLVPVEPPLIATADEEKASRRRAGSQNAPSWYEAQDLSVLKAWSNQIVEIQPEISMFGSLKVVDLHNNELTDLPPSFADLTALTVLDLSHNKLHGLPPNLWALPNLTTLNLSHNELQSLPFFSPFAAKDSNPLSRTRDPRGDWYAETITRATVPLPKLTSLDASHNNLTASGVEHEPDHLPSGIAKLNLSSNPLGNSVSLVRACSRLEKLAELHLEHAEIGDDSFPLNVLSEAYTPFPSLIIFDVGETHVTRAAIEAAFVPKVHRDIEFDLTTEAPKPGVLRIMVGKRVVKEAWEVEAENRAKLRSRHLAHTQFTDEPPMAANKRGATPEVVKEPWEIEAEQGLATEGARRRARAAMASASPPPTNNPSGQSSGSSRSAQQLQKEAWEEEAEHGLLTAGGRRRARAAAATSSVLSASPRQTPSPPVSTPTTSPVPSASALASPQYYQAATHTLTLPPSNALAKGAHMRSFSLAAKAIPSTGRSSDLALTIPTPTLPLSTIVSQPFSHTLKVLKLVNRRMDPSFSLPADHDGPFLPRLEELILENCNLGDTVPVSRTRESDTPTGRTQEALLPLITALFPTLHTLDLSYNSLTGASLTADALSALILARSDGEPRPGLRHLRLRGNRISELDGFQGVAEAFRGNREVPGWKLEELDLRDNEVGRLPAEMGLLPLDVFLVDGNVFRVPARRVWEREGTKGLLGWLRGRLE
ncbi:L domain-like protein [Trametopsis cervina]|nr:L domain-like protein [Trametopsis cervina]